ncbi:MAG: hypothetical protein WC648_00435 [Candidatus Paceibacterota bacterium]
MKTLSVFAGMSNYFAIPASLSPEEEKIFMREAEKINTLIENDIFRSREETFSEILDESGVSEEVLRKLQHLVELTGLSFYYSRDNGKWLIGISAPIYQCSQ